LSNENHSPMELKSIVEWDWHDAELLTINVDRTNPGIHDRIELFVSLESRGRARLTFDNVYYSLFNMNFGVVVENETIYSIRMLDSSDKELNETVSKWNMLYSKIESIQGLEFITNSTNSRIVVIAENVEVI
jgi:hypothetical protein